MNFYNILVCVLLVVLALVLTVLVDPAEARKKDKKKTVCKYDRKGEESPCDTATSMKEVTLLLKKGDPATCPPTKAIRKPCNDNSMTKKMKKMKDCKYEKKGSDWSECDTATNKRSKVMQLKAGSNSECPATRTKTKSCGNPKNKGSRRSRKDA